MSSGNRREVYNDRERLVSLDFNRAQAFAAADLAEILRNLHNGRPVAGLSRPGYVTAAAGAAAAPLRADVLGGLMITCDAPTLLGVTAGALLAWTGTPGSTDDSGCTFAIEEGSTGVATLGFVPNGGGGPRIDLVECQPVDTLLETDNRDVYNDATGLFSPQTVEKVRAARLVYRVRTGVPGGAPPSPVAGWLPLVVAIVQPTATGWTQADLYDVRPLVGERVPDAFADTDGNPVAQLVGGDALATSPLTNPLNLWDLKGRIEYAFGHYYAGGQLRRSTASSLAAFGSTATGGGNIAYVEGSEAGNLCPGCSLTDAVVHVLALFPLGLPRWVRYSQVAEVYGLRIPSGPQGIVCLQSSSVIAAINGNGAVNATPPSICGAFGSVPGVCLVSVPALPGTLVPSHMVLQGGVVSYNRSPSGARLHAPSGSGAGLVFFNLDATSGEFPGNAVAVYCEIRCAKTTSPPNQLPLVATISDLDGWVGPEIFATMTPAMNAGQAAPFVARVPLLPKADPYATTRPVSRVRVDWGGFNPPGDVDGEMQIVGYEPG